MPRDLGGVSTHLCIEEEEYKGQLWTCSDLWAGFSPLGYSPAVPRKYYLRQSPTDEKAFVEVQVSRREVPAHQWSKKKKKKERVWMHLEFFSATHEQKAVFHHSAWCITGLWKVLKLKNSATKGSKKMEQIYPEKVWKSLKIPSRADGRYFFHESSFSCSSMNLIQNSCFKEIQRAARKHKEILNENSTWTKWEV